MKLFVLASLVGVSMASYPPAPQAAEPAPAPFTQAPSGSPTTLVIDKGGCNWFNSTKSSCNASCGAGWQTSHKVFLGVDGQDPTVLCRLFNGSRVPGVNIPIGFIDIGYTECQITECSGLCAKCNITGSVPGADGCTVENGEGACICKAGYGGLTCSNVSNLCNPSPCKNGGTCQSMNDTVVCRCANGFGGPLCEADYCTGFCQSGNFVGCYKDNVGETYCQCKQGFAGQKCDQSTTASVTCSSGCTGHGACANTYGSPVCTCDTGFYGNNCQFQNGSAKLTTACKGDQMANVMECAISTTGNSKCDMYKSYVACATGQGCKDVAALWSRIPPVAVDASCVNPSVDPSPSCDTRVYELCWMQAKKNLHGFSSAPFCVSTYLLANCAAQSGCTDFLAVYCPSGPCPPAKNAGINLPADCDQLA